jgi:regulator of replication initiation timing
MTGIVMGAGSMSSIMVRSRAEIGNLRATVERLCAEVNRLRAENARLRTENERLRAEPESDAPNSRVGRGQYDRYEWWLQQ